MFYGLFIALYFGSAFLTFNVQAEDSAGHHGWKYPDLENSEEFPEWGGECNKGRQQSPINIDLSKSLKGFLPNIEYFGYKSIEGCNVKNNGHSIQLSNFPQKMSVSGGPFANSYAVEQIHFHWWSEHTINKMRYPFEMHIVHRNEKYSTFAEAVQNKDGVAVIGILYHQSNVGNNALKKLSNFIKPLKNVDMLNKEVKLNESILMTELIPESISTGYVTYDGSLTTPSCDETVKWVVFLKTFPVTLDEIKNFMEIENSEGKPLKNNYRPVQRYFNRPVVAIIESASTSSTIYVSWLLIILSVLFSLRK